MVEKFIKFIKKSPHKWRLEKVMKDILNDNLWWYDIKTLTNLEWHYRIRLWSIRIIYKKTEKWNFLIKINNRGDSYKN